MCRTDRKDEEDVRVVESSNNNMMPMVLGFCALIIVAELASVIALAFKDNGSSPATTTVITAPSPAAPSIVINTGSAEGVTEEVMVLPTTRPPAGENPCEGKKPDLPNVECLIVALDDAGPLHGPQAGANVTKGFVGKMEVDHLPITTPYWEAGLCPVNVHWHLGAEHYSLGEFDETGSGPTEIYTRRKLAGETREGFQCTLYDSEDPKFTTPYEWKYCVDMEVGQTYEVHWPHSAAGACGTLNQYQTPFYDGVFCRDGVLTATHEQIGVQAQVFTIVNDEDYYYPDLMRGMIVDGEMGQDMAIYTGSTTGTTRNNEVCSQYSPITWQVDRKCHMVSASAFDKMCADMLSQRDDMSDDLYPHGARELVDDYLAANNQQSRKLRGL